MRDNQLQMDMDSLYDFTNHKQMRIKDKKSKIIKFNFSKVNNFPPEFTI